MVSEETVKTVQDVPAPIELVVVATGQNRHVNWRTRETRVGLLKANIGNYCHYC
jgi:hypothetical protein